MVPGDPQGSSYFLTGTFNDWRYDEMEDGAPGGDGLLRSNFMHGSVWRSPLNEADPNVPGLYVSTIRIATNVEEEQQTQFPNGFPNG